MPATVAEAVLWSKERVDDELHAFIHQFGKDIQDEEKCELRFSCWPEEKRTEYVLGITKYVILLGLPDDHLQSLMTLNQHQFWNEEFDTFWDDHEKPEDYTGW